MIGAGSSASTVIPIVVATAFSVVGIITTTRAWLRSYVDDRADARIAATVLPAVTALQIDMAVVKRDRQRRGQP